MPVNAHLRTLGILGAAVLALTACGPDEADPSPGEGDATGSDQRDEHPEGDADQNDDSGGADDDDSGVPPLADIEERLWENSAAQDSVTILSDIPAALIGIQEPETEVAPGDLDEEAEGAEEAEPEEEDEAEDPVEEDTENIEVIIGGDMVGEGSVWQIEDLMDFVLYDSGEAIYQTVESFIEEYRQFQPDEAAGPSADALGAELEAVGTWVDVSSTTAERIETPARYIEHLDDELLATAGISSLSEVGFSGVEENRDGQDVWVYLFDEGDDHIELIVTADQEEPLISELSIDSDDLQFSITFTDWNESEELAVDEPAEEEVISEDELDAIGQSLM